MQPQIKKEPFSKLEVTGFYLTGNMQMFMIVAMHEGEAFPYEAQDGSRWTRKGEPMWDKVGVGNSLQWVITSFFHINSIE